jgi:hypothetical protein
MVFETFSALTSYIYSELAKLENMDIVNAKIRKDIERTVMLPFKKIGRMRIRELVAANGRRGLKRYYAALKESAVTAEDAEAVGADVSDGPGPDAEAAPAETAAETVDTPTPATVGADGPEPDDIDDWDGWDSIVAGRAGYEEISGPEHPDAVGEALAETV